MQNNSSTSTSTSTRHIRGDVNDDDDGDGDDYYFDHYSSSKYYPHQGNYSITTSVTIRVTPEHYRLLNWAILWGGFVCGVALAAYQVRQEAQWLAARKRAEDLEQQRSSMATTNTSLPFRPSNYTGASHPFNPMMQHGQQQQQQQQQPSNSSSSAAVVGGGEGDGEGTVSSADWSRSRFRRLLLVALVTRTVMIPVQLWSSPLWSQFVADTLPEMTFASAWTLLVSFIVQLVGVATGTAELRYNNNSHAHNHTHNNHNNNSNNNNNINGTAVHDEGFIGVVQWIAYGLYAAVLATYFWNPVASVLLYALLCCIYAGLFGTSLWFAPRLLWLLYPNLQEQMALAVRLIGGSALVIFVLAGRTVGFARKVVAPPDTVSWWWQYGILELIPAILFLLMMRPKSIATTVGSSSRGGGRGGGGTPPNQQHYQHNRTRSSSPAASSSRGGTPPQGAIRHLQQQQREATPLLKSGAGKSYTSTVTAAAPAGGDHQ